MIYKKCFYRTILLCVIFLLNSKIFPQNKNVDNFRKAKLLMMEGQYSKSASLINKLILKDSTDIDYLYYLALNYQAVSNFQKASVILEKALKIKPGDKKLMTLLGNNYYSAGRISNADSVLTKAFKADSNNFQIMLSLGKVLMHERKWMRADGIYKILVKKDSSNSFYYEQQAKCKVMMKDMNDAIVNFQIAHRLNPQNQNTILELSDLYVSLKKYIPAMRIIDDGIKYYPNSSAIWTEQGSIYFKMKKYSDAIAGFKKSIIFGDSSETNYKSIGVSYYWLGKYDTAVLYLSDAVKLNLHDPAAYFYLGTSYKGLKKYDEAIKNLRIAAKLQQNDFLGEAFIQIASTYYEQKKYSKAIKIYENALRENPGKKVAIFYLAVVYDHYYADKTVAIKYYQKFLSTTKNPDKKLVSYATDRINDLIAENHFRKAEKNN